MRKSLLRLMLGGLAIVSAVSMANAQTLTLDWRSEKDIPDQTNVRWGAGFDGKVYCNDKSVPTIYVWDETGERSDLGVGGAAGVGMTFDAVGNAIIQNGFAGAGSMTSFKIWNKTTNELTVVPITIPEGASAARLDIIARAVGDVTSDEGGAIFLCGTGNTAVSKIYFANGVQDVEKSKTISVGVALDNLSIALPLTDDPESDEFVYRLRGQTDFYYNDGTEWKAFERVGAINTTGGGEVVTLNGVLYTIEPIGPTSYKDGFQIVDRSTNTVVATHEESVATTASSGSSTGLYAQKIDEYTARIYQYQPNGFVAQYTFSLPKPEYPENLYIIGSVTDPSWDPETGIKMENEGDGVYTAQIITISGSDNIGIVSVLDSDWDNVVNKNRWGFATNNAPVTIGEAMPIVKGTGSILIGAIGTFDVTVSLKDMTILVEEIEEPMPETLYVVGNIMEDAAFAPDNGKELIKDADANIYRGEKIRIYSAGAEGYGYFALASELGADENDWNTHDTHRYGAAEKDTEITSGGAAEIGKNGVNSYKVLADTYNFEVNLDNGTIILTKIASGVEKIDGTVAAVAGRGEIRIVGEPQGGISIYNLTGQTIVAGSNEKSFNMAAGVYLVNIDGQTMKVVVR